MIYVLFRKVSHFGGTRKPCGGEIPRLHKLQLKALSTASSLDLIYQSTVNESVFSYGWAITIRYWVA